MPKHFEASAFFCSILLALFFAIPCFAQKNVKTIRLNGRVQDYITHTDLLDSRVAILNASDSTVIDSAVAHTRGWTNKGKFEDSRFGLTIPRKPGDYILRATKKGFETAYMNLHFDRFYKREISRQLEPIYLRRPRQVMLDEVVVKATKVKFYNKGDTLVYNADAFQLGEGSMLDALIRQLPGAELRKDGRIYVNGRFVESLLLNGKDFFRGDNSVMLKNLPTYMVDKIKVYDKLGDRSRFMGHEVAGDKQYVMDVNLKKQYNIGWVGNMQAGGGTKDRYLARLFAMRFTDHSRLTVYGNINNLNDDRKPGENDDWKPSDLVGGLTQQQLGGIDYNIDHRDGKYKLSGNAQVSHADNTLQSRTNRTNFLTAGDTYDRILSSGRNHDFKLTTKHDLYFEWKYANLELWPTLEYRHYDHRSSYRSLTLGKQFSGFGQSQLDSLFTPKLGRDLLREAINRNMREGLTKGHSLKAGLSASSDFKFKHNPDYITLYAEAEYEHAGEDSYSRNRVDYYNQGSHTATDYRHRYFDNRPAHGFRLLGNVGYTYFIAKGISVQPYYTFERKRKNPYSRLYRLDQLSDWGAGTDHELGTLPSAELYQSVMDRQNSYNSRQTDDTHKTGIFFWMNKKTKKSFWWVQFTPDFSFVSSKMHYRTGLVDTTFTKHFTLYNMSSTHVQWNTNDQKYMAALFYHVESKAPETSMFVNVVNTVDPLNVITGNADLKTSQTHDLTALFRRMYPHTGYMWAVEAEYTPTHNAIAMGYTYDKATGRRTFRPDNVNGNWKGHVALVGAGPLNKKRTLDFKATAQYLYQRSVDLIGVAGAQSASRSVVKSSEFNGQLQLNYQFGESSIGLKGEGLWSHITGTREGFESFNVSDCNYGLTAQLQLPWKLRLGTDLTMYSRSGYNDDSMNSNDLVWNARLSRPFLKGKLVLMLDGFDILGKLNNVTRTINAQGFTESYTNVIPRYMMLHLVFRFHVSPKKR